MQNPTSQRTNTFRKPQPSGEQYQLLEPQNIQQVGVSVQEALQRQEPNLFLNSGLQNVQQNHHEPHLLHSQPLANHQIQPTHDIIQHRQHHQSQYQQLEPNGLYVNEHQSIMLQKPSPRRPIFQNVSAHGTQQPLHNLQYSQQHGGPQQVLQAQQSHYSDSAQYSQNVPVFNSSTYSQFPNHPPPSQFSQHSNLHHKRHSNYRSLTQPSDTPQPSTDQHIEHSIINHSHRSEEIQQTLPSRAQHTGFINSHNSYSRNSLVTNNRSVSDIPSSFHTNPQSSSLHYTPAPVSSSQQPRHQAEEVELQFPSVSTSPAISFQNGPIHHEQQEAVVPQSGGKIRSVLKRFFGPQKGVRDASGNYEHADGDHASVSASSHHSSTDLHLKPHLFNNSLRRVDRRKGQAERPPGRVIHDPHANEFASFPPPNPSSMHQSVNRSASSLRITEPMKQRTNFYSTAGPNPSTLQESPSVSHQPHQDAPYAPTGSINSSSLNRVNNQNRSLSNFSVPTHGKATHTAHYMSVNPHPTGLPKRFSDRPPTQTGSSVIKVTPKKPNPSRIIPTKNPQQIQSTIHGLQQGHKTNSNITAARRKPPRQPSLRPTAQPIRKQPPSSSRLQRSFSSASQVITPVSNSSNISQEQFISPKAQMDETSTLKLPTKTTSNHQNYLIERNSHQIPTMISTFPVPEVSSNVDQTNISFNNSYQNSKLLEMKENSDQASRMNSSYVEPNSSTEKLTESENGTLLSNVPPFFQGIHSGGEIINPSAGKQNFEIENQNPSSVQRVPAASNLGQISVQNNSNHHISYNGRSEYKVSSLKSPNNTTIHSRRSISLQNKNTPRTRQIRTENAVLGNNLDRTYIPPLDISYKSTTRSDGPSVKNPRKLSSSKTASTPKTNNRPESSRPAGSIFRDSAPLLQRRINSSTQNISKSKPVQPLPQTQPSLTMHQSQKISSHPKKLPSLPVSSESGLSIERKAPKRLQCPENATKNIPKTSTVSTEYNHETIRTRNRNSRIQRNVPTNMNSGASNGINSPHHSKIEAVPSRIPSPTTSSKIKPKVTTVQSAMMYGHASQFRHKEIHSKSGTSHSSSVSTSTPSSIPDPDYQNDDFSSIKNIRISETDANRPLNPNQSIVNKTSEEPKNSLEMNNQTPKNSVTFKKPISLNSPHSSSTILVSKQSMQQLENTQGNSIIFSQHSSSSSSVSAATISSNNPTNVSSSDPSIKSENGLTSNKSQVQIQFEESNPIKMDSEDSESPSKKFNSSENSIIFRKTTITNVSENAPSKPETPQFLHNSGSPSTIAGVLSQVPSTVANGFLKTSGYDDENYLKEKENDRIENGVNGDMHETEDQKSRIKKLNNSDQIVPGKRIKTGEEPKYSTKALVQGSEHSSGIQIRRLAGPISKTIPKIQNELHPDVKAACSSVEINGIPNPSGAPKPALSLTLETTDLPIKQHTAEETEIVSSVSISREKSEAISLERNSSATSTQDSKEFQTSMTSMRLSFNDRFETDLSESKLSPSVCYSKEDHSELKKIPSVEWTVQNHRSEYELSSFSSFSRSQNSANFSSPSFPFVNLESGADSSDFAPIWSSLPYNSPQLQRRSTLPSIPFLAEDSFSSNPINYISSVNEYSSVMTRINNYERMRQHLRRKKNF